jgi:hypothetical protein
MYLIAGRLLFGIDSLLDYTSGLMALKKILHSVYKVVLGNSQIRSLTT